MVDLSKGEKFSFLGFEFRRILSRNQKWRPHFAPKLKKRTALFAEAQGDLPTVCQPTRRQGDRTDQPDPAGLGELLCGGALEPVLFDGQRLGGKEGSAAPDACPEAQRLRLEEVE